MQIKSLTAKILFSLCLFGLFAACGGGETIQSPILCTISTQASAGIAITPTSIRTKAGTIATFTITTSDGYELTGVSGGGGVLNGRTYTTAPVSSDCTITATAERITYQVTTAGEHVTFNPTSAKVAHGDRATFSITVDAGYLLAGVSATSGGKLDGNVFTLEPVTADDKVTATIFPIVDIPVRTGRIAFVVAPDVLAAMEPLLRQFMEAVSLDTSCECILLASPQDPVSIRTQLQGISELRLAFLIGDIPIVKEQIGPYVHVSDHYYRALKHPYQIPVQDMEGHFLLDCRPGDHLEISNLPTHAVARIKGLSPQAQIENVQAYLLKNLALRNDSGRYLRGYTFVSAIPEAGNDQEKFLSAYRDHPLYAPDEVLCLYDKTATELKDGFLQALRSGKEHCQVNVHGSPNGVMFLGKDSGDYSYLWSDDFADNTFKAKVISLASCSTGDFSVSGYLAGNALFSGNTLLVKANPGVTLYSDNAFYQEARNLDFALGVGRSYMSCYPFTYKGSPGHFFGDPTITLRSVDPGAPRPRLILHGKRYFQEFREVVTFPEPSVGGKEVLWNLFLHNAGNKDLIVNGNAFSCYRSLDPGPPWEVGDSPSGFLVDESIKTDGRGNYSIIMPPGQSTTLNIRFIPGRRNDGSMPLGEQRGTMFFSCNDPEIGAFLVELVAVTK